MKHKHLNFKNPKNKKLQNFLACGSILAMSAKPKRSGVTPMKQENALLMREANGDQALSPQERIFVNYIVRENMAPITAARVAGYVNSETAVVALMKRPRVLNAIAEGRKEFEITMKMSRQKVMDGFMEAISVARAAGEAAPMVSGWREVAKMCGYYEPVRHTLNVTHSGEVIIQKLQSMPDEELLKLAEGVEIEGDFQVLE